MGLGIDIGNYNTKLVELVQDNNKTHLKNFGIGTLLPDDVAYDIEKLSVSIISSRVKELMNSKNIVASKNKNAVMGIAASKSIIKHLVTLEMDDEELSGTLELEAKKQLSGAKSDIIIDYHVLGKHKTELDKINVLLLGTTQNEVKRMNTIASHTGIKNSIFNPEPLALLNSYLANYEPSPGSVDVIIHSGYTNTAILIVGDNESLFFREIKKGTDTFIRDIMLKEKSDYLQASKHIMEKGVFYQSTEDNDRSENENNIEITNYNLYNELVDDIRKTLRYYLKNNVGIHYNNFFLSGGASKLNGFKELIEERLMIKTDYLNPFINIECDQIPEDFMNYTIATGLALRTLIK